MPKSIEEEQSTKSRKHVPIRESEHRRLRIMAAETGTTMTAIVETLINAEYHKHKRRDHEKEN